MSFNLYYSKTTAWSLSSHGYFIFLYAETYYKKQSLYPTEIKYGHLLDVWCRGRECQESTMFWYRTPEILHHHDPSVSSLCWRCDSFIGSHFHILWQCPQIQPFWVNVMSIHQTLTNTPLPLDKLHYLPGLPFPGLRKKIKIKTIISHFIGSMESYPHVLAVNRCTCPILDFNHYNWNT